MKIKSLQLILTVIVIITFPVFAVAGAVSWVSESYTADANAGIRSQTLSGPPLPLTATALDCFVVEPSSGYSLCYYSMSQITSSSMFVTAGRDWGGRATASFSGTYQADMPYFSFNYNLVDAHNKSIFSFEVFDVTTSSSLFSRNLESNTGSGNFLINTPIDHDIRVDFTLDSNGQWYPAWTNEAGASLSFSMSSVVPEPISSTLFIVGGATLGFRRYLKRRRK